MQQQKQVLPLLSKASIENFKPKAKYDALEKSPTDSELNQRDEEQPVDPSKLLKGSTPYPQSLEGCGLSPQTALELLPHLNDT